MVTKQRLWLANMGANVKKKRKKEKAKQLISTLFFLGDTLEQQVQNEKLVSKTSYIHSDSLLIRFINPRLTKLFCNTSNRRGGGCCNPLPRFSQPNLYGFGIYK